MTIERLRRIAVRIDAGLSLEPDDVRWLLGAVDAYERLAPAGGTMDKALELDAGSGKDPWWVVEARQRRNQAISGFRSRDV